MNVDNCDICMYLASMSVSVLPTLTWYLFIFTNKRVYVARLLINV